jgi:hypothetical protein
MPIRVLDVACRGGARRLRRPRRVVSTTPSATRSVRAIWGGLTVSERATMRRTLQTREIAGAA